MFEREMLKVYFVAGTQDCRHETSGSPQQKLLGVLETALRNGITCFQLREKGEFSLQDENQMIELAKDCRGLCRQFGVPFVLNNDVALAVNLGADGIHIGQSDMAAVEAVKLTNGKLFLGISNSSVEHLQSSFRLPEIDYFAVGAIFPTQSKPDAVQNLGVEFVRTARQLIGDKPLVAIGGITLENAKLLRQAGADGVAVISAITQAADKAAAVRQLREIFA
ncbi:thiamine phosphate synthase [Kingella negevensis]|uniref:Thiamine-phosphate synthase n=1 Tax=Kingella negevensis TaxID=1522312 RepID=A0A238TCC3_9NEIS|nr:thiamine phosphate synthase [Kingella negevensis]MDK4684878.1 thiamine phosphate synthase [Kingella negevensis]MDK4698209.1 thiamine phosphate synthase [Kingella negevensis]MDK4707762.1 thiamine phosphate synthase [Kingella negevensis]MDK4709285.1 thiamine phosphate synthase [Kingella negevensis]SNB65518.1 Thiamine-phosphate synthase [Kingella negevensis]